MILVLASVVDNAAMALATELASVASSAVLTCRDLGEQPTIFRYPDFRASSLTVDGRRVAISDIRGVINLLPVVFPDELFFYPSEEREYQAAEYHAMLTFFLSALTCPVINRPTPSALSGPCSSSIAWYYFAKRMGIAVSSMKFDTDNFTNFSMRCRIEKTFEVSYLAGHLLCASETDADQNTIALSRQAKVEYLRAVYERCGEEPRFVTASAVPDISSVVTRRALVYFFERIPQCA